MKTKHAGLTLKKFDLAKVKEHPDNPRVHPPKGTPEWNALKASLEGSYFDPLVVNTRGGKNVLVSGHYRRKVMLDMGIRSADMVVVSWDEQTHKARMIAANELLGQFDDGKLRELLLTLETDLDQDLTGITGITDERLKELLATAEPDPEPRKRTGMRQSSITYTLVFDDLEQQELWFGFVRELKARYPTHESIGSRIAAHIQGANG